MTTTTNTPTPLNRLIALLREERADTAVLLAYAILAALLGLATPLAAQALVNTIAAGVSLQPLVVLALLLLTGLVLAGGLNVLQFALVETIQQRIFARMALRMAGRLVGSEPDGLSGRYGPELVNRFFDVLTVQKTLAKLLLDGLAAGLQALVGLVILAFYDHGGLLLGFDALVLLTVAFIIWPLGIQGLRTSQAESAAKYRVAAWLEELARCHADFKRRAEPSYLRDRAEKTVVDWLAVRRAHFVVTLRQETGNQLFQALATAGVLAIGGYLVIQRQITLGQLVAAQLIVSQVVKALDKLLHQADTCYDLLTGLYKTGYITDLLQEHADDGDPLPVSDPAGARVVCTGLTYAYSGHTPVLDDFSITLEPGTRVSLVGASGAGKSTLAALLSGLAEPSRGRVEVNGADLRLTQRSSLRAAVGVVGFDDTVFHGTIEDNIRVGRTAITMDHIRHALDISELANDVAALPEGLHTMLLPGGTTLSGGQRRRLLLARAIAARPALLILDEALVGIDEVTTLRILDRLRAPENGWTLLFISHDGAIVRRTDSVFVLADGRIVAFGAPTHLAQIDPAFRRLFPDLSEVAP
jgi:ATP-binding cassette subfamily B protein